MTFEELLRYCRRDIARSRTYSTALPRVCRLALDTNYVAIAGAWLIAIFTLNQWLLAATAIFLALVRWIRRSPLLAPLASDRLQHLPDVTDDLESADRELLRSMCRRCGLDANQLRVLSDPGSPAATPSVSYVDPHLYIILPGGFFGVWQGEPAAAEGMIAHEIGHVLQGDVELYIKFQRYMRFIISRYIPFLALAGAVAAGTSVLAAISARDEMSMRLFTWTSGLTNYSYYESYSNFALGIETTALLVVACLAITVLLTAALLLIFRILNFRSEAVCDRIALAVTRNDGIQRALELFKQRGDRWPIFTPPLAWRRKKLALALGALDDARGDLPSDAPPPAVAGSGAASSFLPAPDDFRGSPVRLGWTVGRVMVWFLATAALLVWIRSTVVTKPFGLSEPTYNTDTWPWNAPGLMAALSRDGSLLAVRNRWSGTIDLIETQSQRTRARIRQPKPWLRSLDFNDAGTRLLVVPKYDPPEIFKTTDGALLATFPEHLGLLDAKFLRASGDDRIILGSDYGDVELWSLADGGGRAILKKIKTLNSKRNLDKVKEVVAIGLRPDRAEALVISELSHSIDEGPHQFAIWDSDGNLRLAFQAYTLKPDKASLSADGQWLGFTALGSTTVARRGQRPQLINILPGRNPLANGVRHMAFAPDASVFVSEYDPVGLGRGLAMFGPPQGDGARAVDWPRRKLSAGLDGLDDVRWSSDGRSLLEVANNHIVVVAVANGKPVIDIRPGRLVSLRVSHGLKYAATAHDDGTLRIWDLQHADGETRAPVFEQRFDHLTCVGSTSKEGEFLVQHAGGSSVINVDAAVVTPSSSDEPCRPLEQSRFVFRGNMLVDRAMNWSIDLKDKLVNPVVISAPAPGHYWNPIYRIIHRSSGVSVTEISSADRKQTSTWMVVIAWIIVIGACEAAIFVWRRYTTPY